jgi:hypothetical protein
MNSFPLRLEIVIIILSLCVNAAPSSRGASPSDDVSGDYYDWTKTLQPERPWIRDYNRTLVMKCFLCQRDGAGNVRKVFLTYPEVLEVVKKLDTLTLGLPKILYLVGWQYNGHDSKYPSWDGFNERLKRPEDANAKESLKWLMREAKAWHTTISLHLNMIDAFEESPLWAEYLAKNIIAKDASGKPIKGEVFDGMQSYQISFAQEWKLGYTQKRIDRLIAQLPELKEGGTIHVDAFHSMRPSGPGEPISPYLHISTDEEIAAQRRIFRYWRNQGIDVTCEGGKYWLRKDPFLGLQALSWHYDENTFANEDWPNKPGEFTSLPADLCAYTPMQAELVIMKDPIALPGLIQQFCLNVVPWYYKRNRDVSRAGTVIFTDDEVVCPVLWKPRALVAFSRTGFAGKKVRIPSNWVDVKKVSVSLITLQAIEKIDTLPVREGIVALTLEPNRPVVLQPAL